MELLINWKNPPYTDRRQQTGLFMQGDVIIYKPDGWEWSPKELSIPSWRIIRVDLTESECDALIASEIDPANSKTLLRTRARKLNHEQVTLPSDLADFLDDETRATPIYVVRGGVGRAVVRAMEYIKPAADSGNE